MKRILGFVALALVAALTLAACGRNTSSGSSSSSSNTNSSSSSGSSGAVNKADVTFTQSMIPHHQQAVQMAKMAKQHASTPEVKDLATEIEAAQGPEIETMAGWLEDWGKKVPSGSMSGMEGMGGMDMSSMPGMMSNMDMSELGAASGGGFDRMFLTMMVKHHTGAIEMAETEQAEGKNSEVISLAKTIEAAQTAEVARMKHLLES